MITVSILFRIAFSIKTAATLFTIIEDLDNVVKDVGPAMLVSVIRGEGLINLLVLMLSHIKGRLSLQVSDRLW